MKKVEFAKTGEFKKGDVELVVVENFLNSQKVQTEDTLVYLLDGQVEVRGGEVIALEGSVKCEGYTKVYPVGNVEITGEGDTRPQDVKVIHSQEDWDWIQPEQFKVIVIKSGDIDLDYQKSDHIVVLDGHVTLTEGVSVFIKKGRVTCLGGEVIGWDTTDEGSPLSDIKTLLVGGDVYQHGGELVVMEGRFKTAYLKRLSVRKPLEVYGEELDAYVG